MKKLKACPFCGAEDWKDDTDMHGVYILDHNQDCWFVLCYSRNSIYSTELDYEDKIAIKLWNTRK